MPYIDKDKRAEILHYNDHTELITIDLDYIQCAGDFNFLVSTLISMYIEREGESYKVHNELIGFLECAKLELYRRHTARLEDEKIRINGDI